MRLQSLNHLIEVVRAVARPHRIVMLGSCSLLPSHPELGNSGNFLELTTDADFLLEPCNEAIAESLQFAVGQESAFMSQFGYYADILRPEMVETLPAGWEGRLHPIDGFENAFALDSYDLALVKLAVGRAKDLELVRAMLQANILDRELLRNHYQQTPMGEREAATVGRNLTATLEKIGNNLA